MRLVELRPLGRACAVFSPPQEKVPQKSSSCVNRLCGGVSRNGGKRIEFARFIVGSQHRKSKENAVEEKFSVQRSPICRSGSVCLAVYGSTTRDRQKNESFLHRRVLGRRTSSSRQMLDIFPRETSGLSRKIGNEINERFN